MAASSARTITFGVHGPILRTDLPGLCARVCRLLEGAGPEVAFCDVAGVPANAVTADALARLQTAAHRHGCRVRLRHASADLLELLAFIGLEDVF